MKKLLALCALGAAFAATTAAHADTFSITFGGYLANGAAFSTVTGPGQEVTFTTVGTPSNGSVLNPNEYAISDLTGEMVISGVTYTIGALESGLGGANELADNFRGVLSPNGFDFALSTTASPSPNPDYSQFLVEYNATAADYTYKLCNHNNCTISGTLAGADIYDITTAPAATPEPGSLALLGTSILGGAGLLRRRFMRS